MKRLGKIVSIVPVIAKADTLTMEERQDFKQRVSPPPAHCHDLYTAVMELTLKV